NAETIERLVREGWVQAPDQSPIIPQLETQLHETIFMATPEGDKAQVWYKPDARGHPLAPVVLAFSIDNPHVEPQAIPMLNPFPVPQFGEYAFVVNEGESALTVYHIASLPLHVQSMRGMLGELLRVISAPLLWPAFSERCVIASNEHTYHKALLEIKGQGSFLIPRAV